MKRATALALLVVLASGCGTYRITYRFPSQEKDAEKLAVHEKHSHGIGLVGGGGYFFAVHQMFPALIDYSGEKSVAEYCPNGVYEITHYHEFAQNALAALISWLIVVNVWHQSNVEWRCVKEPAAPAAVEAPVDPSDATTGSIEAPEPSTPHAEDRTQ